MKRHAAFFIGLLTILLLMGWWLQGEIHILNETWWKSFYTSDELNNEHLEVKLLKEEADGEFYNVKYADNTFKKIDVLGVFSDNSQTVYLDLSNHYLMKVENGTATQKIFIDDEVGEVIDAVSDGRGNSYVYGVQYGNYASWIEKERILKFNEKGQLTKVVYEASYQDDDRPFLSGTISNMKHSDKGLQFYQKTADHLTHYSYDFELKEDFSLNLAGLDLQILDLAGDEMGEIVFTTNNSEIGLITETGQVDIQKNFLDDKKVVKGLSVKDSGEMYISLQNEWFKEIEQITLINGQLKFKTVKADEINTGGPSSDLSKGLTIGAGIKSQEWLYIAGFVVMIALLIYTLFFGFKYLMQGRSRIFIKQLLFLIPIVLIVMMVFVLQAVLNGFEEFGDEIKQGKYAQFNEIVDYQLNTVAKRLDETYLIDFLESVQPYQPIDKEAYETFYSTVSLEQLQQQSDYKTKALREDVMAMYVVVDRVIDDKVYKILDTENKFKLFTPRDNDNAYFQKARNGQLVNAIGTGDAYIFSMQPIYNKDREVVGIYQIGMKYAGYRQQLDTNLIMSSVMRIILLTIALMVAITVTTIWSLRTIGTLTKGVREVSAGNMGVQIDIHSNDEVSELANAFNGMTKSLSDYIDEIQSLSESYYRFVPQEIFKLLGNENVKEIYKGDSGQFNAVILAAGIEGFYKKSSKLAPEESFEWINNHLGCMGPIIRKHGGLVERYTDIGLIAIFPKGSEEAVEAAVEINRQILAFMDEGKDYSPVNMVLHRGDILVGVVGEEKRLQSGIISDDVGIVQQLLERSDKLSSRILMTESVLTDMTEQASYEMRNLGKLQLSDREEEYHLYDVYESDALAIRSLKRQYGEAFDQAVNAFMDADYYIARSEFVKILENNLKDGAARVYFHASDKHLREGRTESTPLEI